MAVNVTDPATLFTPTTVADPFPAYDALRDRTPLVTGATGDVWVLMRYADVYGALSDPATFSSSHPGTEEILTRTPMIFDDDPRHGRFRRLVNKAFTPRRIADAEPRIRDQVDRLLDGIGPGPVEAMSALCIVLPIYVIADMLGVPRADQPAFKRWSEYRSHVVGTSAAMAGKDDGFHEAEAGSRELDRYFAEVTRQRRLAPADDLVSGLVLAESDGRRLEEWEVLGVCALLLTAGNVTTTNLIGNMLGILAARPDLYRRARTDRSLVTPIVEETLRFQSPVQWFFRRTTREVEVAGTTIPAEARTVVFFGAANRDPAGFDDPDTFRVDRDLSRHIAFGHGIHHCLGAPLARLEATVALHALLDRYPAIEPGAEPAVRQTGEGTHLGYHRLPLVLRDRA